MSNQGRYPCSEAGLPSPNSIESMNMVNKTPRDRFAICWTIYVAACLAPTGTLHAQGATGAPQHQPPDTNKAEGIKGPRPPRRRRRCACYEPFPHFLEASLRSEVSTGC